MRITMLIPTPIYDLESNCEFQLIFKWKLSDNTPESGCMLYVKLWENLFCETDEKFFIQTELHMGGEIVDDKVYKVKTFEKVEAQEQVKTILTHYTNVYGFSNFERIESYFLKADSDLETLGSLAVIEGKTTLSSGVSLTGLTGRIIAYASNVPEDHNTLLLFWELTGKPREETIDFPRTVNVPTRNLRIISPKELADIVRPIENRKWGKPSLSLVPLEEITKEKESA